MLSAQPPLTSHSVVHWPCDCTVSAHPRNPKHGVNSVFCPFIAKSENVQLSSLNHGSPREKSHGKVMGPHDLPTFCVSEIPKTLFEFQRLDQKHKP